MVEEHRQILRLTTARLKYVWRPIPTSAAKTCRRGPRFAQNDSRCLSRNLTDKRLERLFAEERLSLHGAVALLDEHLNFSFGGV